MEAAEPQTVVAPPRPLFIVTMYHSDMLDVAVNVLKVVGSLQACQRAVLKKVCSDWRRVGSEADVETQLEEHFAVRGCPHLAHHGGPDGARQLGSYSMSKKTYCEWHECYRFQDPIYTIWEVVVERNA